MRLLPQEPARFASSTTRPTTQFRTARFEVRRPALPFRELSSSGRARAVTTRMSSRPIPSSQLARTFPPMRSFPLGAAGHYDHSITIRTIQDYFGSGTVASGIWVAFGSAWTITGNRFFQTGTRTATASSISMPIQISDGGGYTISSNTIGFANAGGTGSTVYATTGAAVLHRFWAMDLTLAASPVSEYPGQYHQWDHVCGDERVGYSRDRESFRELPFAREALTLEPLPQTLLARALGPEPSRLLPRRLQAISRESMRHRQAPSASKTIILGRSTPGELPRLAILFPVSKLQARQATSPSQGTRLAVQPPPTQLPSA